MTSTEKNDKVHRRTFLKYAAGAVGVGAVAAAGYGIWSYTQPPPPPSSGEPIILGVAEDIHGTNGPGIIKSIELAVKEINDAGGSLIKGQRRMFQVVVEDTKEEQPAFVASDVITAVTKLIEDDKVNVVFGGFGGSGYIVDVAAQYKTIYISGSGGTIDHTKITPDNKYKYVFQDQIDVNGWGIEEAQCLLYYANKYKAKKISVLMEDFAFFHTHLEIFKDLLTAKNGIELDPVVFFPSTKTGFSAELEAIRGSGAPVTFPGFVVVNSTPFMQEWRDTQLKTFLAGVDMPGGMPDIGPKTHGVYDYLVDLEGLARTPISDMTVPFYDAYLKYAGRSPDIYDGNYYSGVYMYKGAIEKAQTLDSDAVAQVIHDNEWQSVFGKIKFNDHNFVSPSEPVEAGFVLLFSQWQNQQLKVVWPEKFAEGPTLYPPWHPLPP